MRKGFTLIELLIVIAILAILATVVVLVLNPAELLRESRDGQRLSDMSTLNTALALYATTASSPDLDAALDCATDCYTNIAGMAANCGGRHAVARVTTTDTTREVDGNGWMPVDFTASSGGSPLSVLPVDPAQSTTLFYSYACDNTLITWEINADLESARYAGGGDDKEGTDGGSIATIYEIGNDPGLDL